MERAAQSAPVTVASMKNTSAAADAAGNAAATHPREVEKFVAKTCTDDCHIVVMAMASHSQEQRITFVLSCVAKLCESVN